MRRQRLFARAAAAAVLCCMLGNAVFPGIGMKEVRAEEPGDAGWDEIQSVVSRYYGEWNDTSYPGLFSDKLPNTALLGNGDVGVTSGGDDISKSFYISKSDFWTYGTGDFSSPCPPLPIGGITIGKEKGDEEIELGENIAPMYESVTASSHHDDFTPDKAVNGNMQQIPEGYGWVSKRPQDSEQAGNTEFWIQLKFKEPIKLARYVIKNDGAVRAGMEENNTQDFQLQISSDGAQWMSVDTVTGNSENVYDKDLYATLSTTYVRLLITNANQGTTSDSIQNPRARIGQLELYAEPKSGVKSSTEIAESEEAQSVQFHEKQDILNAEIQTTQKLADVPTEMKTWISADKNIMVTELKSNGTEDAGFQVDTWASVSNRQIRPITVENDASTVTVTRSTQNKAPDNPKSHTSKAALSTKIVGVDDVEAFSDETSGKGSLKFTLGGGQTAYIVTAIGGGGRTYTNTGALWEGAAEPTEDAANLLGTVNNESDVDSLNQARMEWWKNFWSASYVDFGTEDENLNKVQKYYYGAQYILGSTAKEGKLAPGLYGIWHTTDNASWSSDYHLNYNFIATFYGTNSSNRPEISLPGVQALLDYVPEGQRRASSIDEIRRINADFVNKKVEKGDISEENGIPGAILFPVGIGPWGTTTDNVYLSEALDASYNSYLMTQYYDYTLDESFLETGVYDYMKQVATFYEAWLEKEDGKYVLYAGYNEGSWAINPAVELAALKNTLRHLISASEALGKDADKREKWVDIYTNLGEQPTTEVDGKKVLALGEKQWNGNQWIDLPSPIPGDGNALPLDAMIPGGVYTYFSSPEDLQMIQDTIDVFSARGAWSQINNFPRIFPEAVKSRYPIDTVVTKLVDVINRQMAPNLRINDNTHGVEKSGSTETINSMMLISDDGITKVFPNWYEDKDAKFAHLRAKGAFTVSAEYDGTTKEAKNISITSEKGAEMTLVSPWAEGATVRDSSGNIVKTTQGNVPNWEDEKTITFATTAGETYQVEKGQEPIEPEISKKTLEIYLDKAKQYKANGDVDGMIESIQKLFDEAIAEGEAVMADDKATEADVCRATVKLMKAIQSLGFKTGDKTDLGMALKLTEMIDLAHYVEAGQAEYLAAKAAAKAVMADENALPLDVDEAWNALVEAMANLRLKADKTILAKLLESLKDLDLDKYTEETAAVYKEALAAANAVMQDENLSASEQAKVDDIVKNLKAARDGLKEKEDSGGGSNGGDNGGNNGDQNGDDNQNGGNNGDNGDNNQSGGNNSGDNGQSGSKGQNGNNNGAADKNTSGQKSIKTGDKADVLIPIMALGLSLVVLIAAGTVMFKRRNR